QARSSPSTVTVASDWFELWAWLTISASTAPKVSSAASITRRGAPGSPRSASTDAKRPGGASRAPRGSPSYVWASTRQPSSTRRRAIAKPIPAVRPTPVTTATLPCPIPSTPRLPRPRRPDSAGRRHQPRHRFADEARLRGSLDRDRELGHRLPPAALELVEGDQLGGCRDLAVDRHRGREANLVPAVVHAEGESGRLRQFFAEAVGQRQGQVAVGDRRPVGALGLRPLRIDVDPLVVAGDLGEAVDQLLGDRARLARSDLLADDSLHPRDPVDLDSRHQSVHQSGRISPSLS